MLAVVRDGSFLGVLAEREDQAEAAAAVLQDKAHWRGDPLPGAAQLYANLLSQESQDFLVIDSVAQNDSVRPIETPADTCQTLSATYYRPYHMHAALGPAAVAARWHDDRLEIWSHTQGVYPLRGSIAAVLDLPESQVRVFHVEGPGCYGHNGADEHAWEAYGSAMVVKMQASLNCAGTVVDWNHDTWSYSHSGRPGPMVGASNLLAAHYLKNPLPAPASRPGKGSHGGIHRNADPLYAFTRRRVVKHFVADSPLSVSALRGLGSFANVFAIESFMDELACAAAVDPVEFRLRHLHDPRACAVIEAAVALADWHPGVHNRDDGRGQGLGLAQYKNAKCYVAVVFDVTVDGDSGQVHLDKACVAADAGQIVNPDGLANQLEGGVLQVASWTFKEQVQYGSAGIESRDWDTYPILRFAEVPEVCVKLLDQPDYPSLGSGEATQGPAPAAIANAVFAATGVRLRQMPFTSERVGAVLKNK